MSHTQHPLLCASTALGLAALAACSNSNSSNSNPPPTSAATGTYDSAVAIQWNETLYRAVRDTSTNPPRAARVYAYTGVTLYEAVVHGMPGYQSLEGQLNGLTAATLPDPDAGVVYDWAIAGNRALSLVSAGLITGGAAAFTAQEDSLLATLSTGVDDAVVARSITYGDELAAAILVWAAADGTADQALCQTNWTAPVLPQDGGWTQVSGMAQPLLPCWGAMRTFVVTDSQECEAVGPPMFSTATTSAWHAQALVVYSTTGDLGANLSADQQDIGLYWSDGLAAPTATGTPPGHWIAITCQLADAEDLPLDVSAEAFARVGLAVADAFITCWEEKYTTYLQRPETYIQTNIDANWTPLIGTPNFPTYTSGHSTQSAAAATVLTQMFGTYSFTDTCHSRLNPGSTLPADRTYTSFAAAASEAAVSRLYGGIHYGFDNYDGSDSGICVGSVHNAALQFLAP